MAFADEGMMVTPRTHITMDSLEGMLRVPIGLASPFLAMDNIPELLLRSEIA